VGDNELTDTSIFRKIKIANSQPSLSTIRIESIVLPSICTKTMPTPTIDLKPFQGLITTWFHNDLSAHDIAKRLAEEHSVVCTGRTIERRLREWNVTKQACVIETVALRLKIASMFYMNFPDDMIVRALNEEGCPIGKTAVVQIRRAQGCKRRLTV
jgi:Clr5 domain